MLKLYWDENVYREESAALRALKNEDNALIVGVDLNSPAHAAVDVLRARRAGIPILAYFAAPDPLETMLARVGAQIAASNDDGQRRTHLTALRNGQLTVGGVSFASSAPMSREVAIAGYFICRMADSVAVFTSGETARWNAIFGKPLRSTEYLDVPPIASAPTATPGVTVYAPSTPRAMVGFIEAALQIHGRSAEYITVENSSDTPRTRVVVAPEWWRPARALALNRAGFQVVVPAHSALGTRARVFEYAELSADALSAAIDAAFSAPAGRALWEAAPFALPTPPTRSDSLVSIIVRTYDRPALLERAIDSIVRQTHAAIEIVVVNNGGPDVRAVVERSCGSRAFKYIAHPMRSTISAASNLGARAATGAFIGYLDDDDLLYPDHVSLAVAALERSGADIAYTDCVGEYASLDNGRKRVTGIGIYLDREFSLDALYVSNVAPIHSIVHRRELFDRFGYFDEELPVTDDWDMWLRAAHGARFIHVGRPTCEYSWRIDAKNGNMTVRHQQDFVECYKHITGRWSTHTAGREDIRQAQANMLQLQQQRVSRLSSDPSSAFDVLLGPLLQNAVPVRDLLDEAF